MVKISARLSVQYIGFYRLVPEYVEINGVKVSGVVIPHIIAMLTNPDPTKWYRFERTEDNTIKVETRVTEPQ